MIAGKSCRSVFRENNSLLRLIHSKAPWFSLSFNQPLPVCFLTLQPIKCKSPVLFFSFWLTGCSQSKQQLLRSPHRPSSRGLRRALPFCFPPRLSQNNSAKRLENLLTRIIHHGKHPPPPPRWAAVVIAGVWFWQALKCSNSQDKKVCSVCTSVFYFQTWDKLTVLRLSLKKKSCLFICRHRYFHSRQTELDHTRQVSAAKRQHRMANVITVLKHSRKVIKRDTWSSGNVCWKFQHRRSETRSCE